MEFEKDIQYCVEALHAGGLILYPTDTIWGIGCDATNAKAIDKIYALKKRTGEKSMIVLVADEKEILRYVAQPDLRIFDYLHSQRKPVTVVYEGAIGLADNLVNKDGSIAIRICKEKFCNHLIKRFRKPIVSTSANISGEPFPGNFSGISNDIKKAVDYIVQHRQDDKLLAQPSSLIKLNKDGTITVLRP
jgi:L-threonylcarbamoyladenylate synthase